MKHEIKTKQQNRDTSEKVSFIRKTTATRPLPHGPDSRVILAVYQNGTANITKLAIFHSTTFGHILTKATFYERKSGVVPDSLAKYYQGWRNHGTTGLGQGIRLEEPDRIGEIHRVAAGCTQSPSQTRVRGQVQLKLRLLAWVSGHTPRCTGHRTSPYPLAHLRGLR